MFHAAPEAQRIPLEADLNFLFYRPPGRVGCRQSPYNGGRTLCKDAFTEDVRLELSRPGFLIILNSDVP